MVTQFPKIFKEMTQLEFFLHGVLQKLIDLAEQTFYFQTISSLTVNSKTFFSDLIMNWIITFMLKLGLIIVEKGKEWTRGKFSDNGQGTKREVSCFSSFYNFLFTNHNPLVVN